MQGRFMKRKKEDKKASSILNKSRNMNNTNRFDEITDKIAFNIKSKLSAVIGRTGEKDKSLKQSKFRTLKKRHNQVLFRSVYDQAELGNFNEASHQSNRLPKERLESIKSPDSLEKSQNYDKKERNIWLDSGKKSGSKKSHLLRYVSGNGKKNQWKKKSFTKYSIYKDEESKKDSSFNSNSIINIRESPVIQVKKNPPSANTERFYDIGKMKGDKTGNSDKNMSLRSGMNSNSNRKYNINKKTIIQSNLTQSKSTLNQNRKASHQPPVNQNREGKRRQKTAYAKSDTEHLNFKMISDNNFQQMLHCQENLGSYIKTREKRGMLKEDRLGLRKRIKENKKELVSLESLADILNKKIQLNSEMVSIGQERSEIEVKLSQLEQEMHNLVDITDTLYEDKEKTENSIKVIQAKIDQLEQSIEDICIEGVSRREEFMIEFNKTMLDESDAERIEKLSDIVNSIFSVDCESFKKTVDEKFQEYLQFNYSDEKEFFNVITRKIDEIYEEFEEELNSLLINVTNKLDTTEELQEKLKGVVIETNGLLKRYYNDFQSKFANEIDFDTKTGVLDDIFNEIQINEGKMEEYHKETDKLSKQKDGLTASKMDIKWKYQNLTSSKTFEETYSTAKYDNYDEDLIINCELVECDIVAFQAKISKDKGNCIKLENKEKELYKFCKKELKTAEELIDNFLNDLYFENSILESLLICVETIRYDEYKAKLSQNFKLISLIRSVLDARDMIKRNQGFVELKKFIKTIIDKEYRRVEEFTQSRNSKLKKGTMSKISFKSYKNSILSKKDDTFGSFNELVASAMKEQSFQLYTNERMGKRNKSRLDCKSEKSKK